MKYYSRRLAVILLTGLALFLSGCSSLMVESNTPSSDQNPETARVYFALDQSFPGGNGYITNGTSLLGFIENNTHFVADLPAGEHLLILKSEQDEAIKGNFEAGKTYYIRVFITPGVMRSRTYWTPLENNAEDAKLRDEMLSDTQLTVLVPQKAAEWEKEEKEELEERVESFTSGEDDIKHTIGPKNAF